MSISSLVGFAPRPSSWYQRVQQNWAQPLFGLYLGRAPQASDSNPVEPNGLLTLGGVDSSKYDGEIHYIDANITGWWTIPLEALKVNDQEADLEHEATEFSHINGKPAAVIDSGTTLVNGPKGPVTDMYKKLNAVEITTNLWVFPCSKTSTPKISLTFGGVDYVMNPDDVIIGASTVKYIKERFNANITGADEDYYCRASIDIFEPPTADFAAPAWIIGAAFMRNVYTVHRIDPPAVGFALIKSGADGSADAVPEPSSGSDTGGDGVNAETNGKTNVAAASGASAVVASSAFAAVAGIAGLVAVL